jgi:phosphatidylglycerophosphate synthase
MVAGTKKPGPIPLEYIENINKGYKYSCVDDSILGPLMQPWWNYVVELVPRTVAPNAITLVGFMAVVVAFEFFPDNYLLLALATFVYQTLDAIDGKQARRTGSSSPLGELFDHGCDAVSTGFFMLAFSKAVAMDPMQTKAMLATSYAAFYAAQWNEYYTGTMYLPALNVTEVQVAMMGLFAFIGLVGNNDPAAVGFVVGSTQSAVAAWGAILSGLAGLATYVRGVPSVFDTMLLPVLGAVGITMVGDGTDRYFLLAASLAYSVLVGKVVVARVVHFPYTVANTLPEILALSVGLFTPVDSRIVLGVELALWGRFALGVIHQLTHFLGIHALTI